MQVIVIDSEAFNELKRELEEIVKDAIEKVLSTRSPEAQDWLTLRDSQKILPYRSKAKWQELRDRGEVRFSQMGRKILYSRKSLVEYIERNNVKFS